MSKMATIKCVLALSPLERSHSPLPRIIRFARLEIAISRLVQTLELLIPLVDVFVFFLLRPAAAADPYAEELLKVFHAVEWCFGAFISFARKRFQLNYNLIFTIMFIYQEAAAAAAATSKPILHF